jgi:hypothetical protein
MYFLIQCAIKLIQTGFLHRCHLIESVVQILAQKLGSAGADLQSMKQCKDLTFLYVHV